MTKVRCAIYTRKSNEEGLSQDFNSLDAQFEACVAYIKSQASEGWTLVRERYDDGGISGGTLDRPGLKRLLSDIAVGHIDIVVVYKVDRLTRSLLDFAKLVEALDKAGTSFVSITQSFNTTTSMGRLTLNMLLSFAQFEREVTAERIRDKIAQSKARGMWMGGTPPIGYRPDGRSLAIVEEHAAVVRHIFGRYLELKNVRLLADELEEAGIRSPRRETSTGRSFGGCAFSRGQLYKMLSNELYIGRIPHAGRSHEAKHQPIIDRETWNAVQASLAANVNGSRAGAGQRPSLFAGKIIDDRGVPMVPVHACKGKVRYRYYVSRDLHHSGDTANAEGWRLPAREIEPLVCAQVAALVADPVELLARSGSDAPSPDEFNATVIRGRALADRLSGPRGQAAKLLRALVAQVQIAPGKITIHIDSASLAGRLQLPSVTGPIQLEVPAALKRSGLAMRLISKRGEGAVPAVDRTLVKATLQGRTWWDELQSDTRLTVTDIAKREGITSPYVARIVRLAFLSPKTLKSIIQGKAPAHLTLKRLLASDAIPVLWDRVRS
jgi:DNA invertase Pin-like site-specific DNA recombinase